MIYVAEPSPLYRVRPPLVVDCSLLAAVLFDEPERAQAEQRMAGHALHAPTLLRHELAQVALTKVRRGEPAVAALEGLRDYQMQAIAHHDTDAVGQFELGQRYGLSAYDAAYLWLAIQLRAPLATFDRKLGDAAQAHFDDAR
ncbi:MAG: type II toxin-antitoxin system VapC family toxin [Roseateles sp.]|uniref:type II toxin-antitoxin system VapC family toxin n=1 Tax=Roseateles sp. TaxID=1971397 RepID=UPI0039EB5824